MKKKNCPKCEDGNLTIKFNLFDDKLVNTFSVNQSDISRDYFTNDNLTFGADGERKLYRYQGNIGFSGFNKMREIINFSKRSIDLLNPNSKLARFKENIDENLSKIKTLYSKHLSVKQNLITSYSSQIEQLSPFNVLERGYSIVRNKKGVVVKSIDDISLEEKISVTSAKISYEADITNINND